MLEELFIAKLVAAFKASTTRTVEVTVYVLPNKDTSPKTSTVVLGSEKSTPSKFQSTLNSSLSFPSAKYPLTVLGSVGVCPA